MQDTTKLVLIVAIIALALYDVIAFWHGGQPATLSAVIASYTKENPIIAFAAGLICGHLFWNL